MSSYKNYEDGSAILQLRRDMFKDEQTFESILKFLNLNKDNDYLKNILNEIKIIIIFA